MCARARRRRRPKGCAGIEGRRRARAGVGLVRAQAESKAWAPKTVLLGAIGLTGLAKPAANPPAPHPTSPRERGEERAAPDFPSPRSRGEVGWGLGEFLRRRQDAHAARRTNGDHKIHLTTNCDFRKDKFARFRFCQSPPPPRGLRRGRGYGALSRNLTIRSGRSIDAQARRAALRCAAASAGVAATRARRRWTPPIE